jgi:sortase A
MRKLFAAVLALVLCTGFADLAFAYDSAYNTSYGFSSGPDTASTFGKPSSYDEPVTGDLLATNQRRDKNAAYNPPSYGIFSGDIPTDPSSLYHETDSGAVFVMGASIQGDSSGVPGLPAIAADSSGGSSLLSVSYPDQPGLLPSTSVAGAMNTAPQFYEDGSIGSLFITKLQKTIKVYEGESLDNMVKGIGHFTSTSAYDGNVGLAGHNRGGAAYFGFVKDLQIGDTITYATMYGTRTYTIYSKEKISETDLSSLEWTSENLLTMITCVENDPLLRWCVRAAESR